jgi:branched-chain amino acid transport system ATP-binding protein
VTLLELENLHAYYGEAHILQGVTISVGEGEVVTLIGRNGAGKTTTLRTIMGIVPPRRGQVRLRGENIAGLPTHEIVRRGIAWVPEERRVLPNLTVLENLRLGMLGADEAGRRGRRGGLDDPAVPSSREGRGAAARPRPREDSNAAARPGFGEDRRARTNFRINEVVEFFPALQTRIAYKGRFLSGGEQQMLAIARGLVAAPSLMLVDEPTEGLAPLLVQTLTEVLGEINRRGTTILLVEQTLEVALALSSRIYVMDQGRVQFEGTPDELRHDPTIQQRFLGV